MTSRSFISVLLLPLLGALSACGGGNGPNLNLGNPFTGGGGGGNGGSGSNAWAMGVYKPSTQFFGRCVSPRAGSSDVAGTVVDQNNWLRSWTHELYLWYVEVPDVDPSLYTTPDYFDLLKTSALTASGAPKDKFHFTYDTNTWLSLSQAGTEAGYGAEIAVLASKPPRNIVIAFTDPGTPADGQLFRGDTVLTVDGIDAINENTSAGVDTLNAGLFPAKANENHVLVVRDVAGAQRTVNLTSATIVHTPVPIVTTFPSASGSVGYIQFNDHIATAERPLINAINTLKTAAVTDLILDIRYNGGGYLDLASELAYMIGNTNLTAGRTFEKTVFNDKNPSVNPITGEALTPTPFWTTAQGFPGSVAAGTALPTLNLNRVYIITGPGTCSASESIINSLRGVNVDVYLIGSTTCGKPYGFYPQDNCGTTYFSIEFRGVNAANFGDYTDGFSPANTTHDLGTLVPGCSVADDFSHNMGDPAELRIATALSFRASNNQTCPTASGSSPERVSKASLNGLRDAEAWRLVVSKPAARLNRVLRMSRGT